MHIVEDVHFKGFSLKVVYLKGKSVCIKIGTKTGSRSISINDAITHAYLNKASKIWPFFTTTPKSQH